MQIDWIAALVGGIMIGLASLMLLVFNGRIAGISGICGTLLERPPADEARWRGAFLFGMIGAGALLMLATPSAFPDELPRGMTALIVAGLLVGFGTRMGAGCTSGHGVCGMSRLSSRSIVATMTFMATGVITVALYGWLVGGAA